jgi:fumarylacetoacetate (FAA) hydrolase family protein
VSEARPHSIKARLMTGSLPVDGARAVLIGRVWLPAVEGPAVVRIQPDGVYDLSSVAATSSQLLDLEHPADVVRNAGSLERLGSVESILANSAFDARDEGTPWFLAPCDLQAIKACGVTFVASMLERVIEEQARGDAAKADGLRASVAAAIGSDLARITPGSAGAQRVKDVLITKGMWSQYLEVGIGPDAEVFTKSQPMSAVGTGAEIGIHAKSEWNNPEPEVVLAINSKAEVVGATLGNDVNLRDFEGRSALLLGKAKDNNASCAIGPFIRLFDGEFCIDDVRRCDLDLQVDGLDGFSLRGSSSMSMISRDPLDLVAHATGANHQYPDGAMLFLGTMFAPTNDRLEQGKGFTHVVGDVVTVASPKLGGLVNRVNHCDKIAAWTFGAVALMKNLAARRLI